MSIEIAPEGDHIDTDKKLKENRHMNGNQPGDSLVNGVSNGYSEKLSKKEHKSEHKDKHRDKDRDRHKDKHKDKERHRDKDKHSSGDHKHSSSNSSSKDKERDRDKEKEKRHKDEKRDKEREKDKSSKDKEHKSSSSSSSKDKDKHSSSSSKDKERHSSSHRDKEKSSSSSSHKDKSSSDRKEKDKDRHSSSHSSSRDKDKEKDRDRHKDDKERKHKDKHRDKEREKDKEKEKKPKVEIKEEPISILDEEVPDRPLTPGGIKDEPDYDDTIDSHKGDSTLDEGDDPWSHRDSTLLDTTADSTLDEPRLVIKSEEEDEEDEPLVHRKPSIKKRPRSEEESDDDVPLGARKIVKQEKKSKKRHSSDSEEEIKPKKKKKKETPKSIKKEVKTETASPRKKKKEDEEKQVWKWWEEEKKNDGTKWKFLEHKGPVFAPAYEPLPSNVKFRYDGQEMKLTEPTEEVATFYARMLDHDYTTKDVFNNNFFKDWRSVMTESEKSKITKLDKCDFKQMHQYFLQLSEERKNRTKEEKKALKDQNEATIKEYGFCTIDGHEEKIGNFKIEPPGLFRGRGEHPKMGKLKKRVLPEDVIINCSKDSKFPTPPEGHKWKEVRHDPSVTWLASWNENVQGQVKYVMLNPSSKLKGEKDWAKYETARKLAKSIEKIRQTYREDWKSKEMRIRQRAVALYFIDKLALRAGNEKDEDQADTVGCCSLRVEHIELLAEKDDKENVVVFDFLGKDSIRYYNEVSVEKRVFKNLQLFMQNKEPKDDLFDRLNTAVMNKHLNDLMEGLTAKVFRTFNASFTLQEQLKALTKDDMTIAEKILAYNRANRAVAVLCNHQRAVPKTHAKSMENLKNKIETKREQVAEAEKAFKKIKKESKHSGSAKTKMEMEKKRKALDRLREQLQKLEVQATDKEENKEIALGTSKLNYLDPRISVAWCKKNGVPIEKIYNKTQRDKFRWAIDMAGADYEF